MASQSVMMQRRHHEAGDQLIDDGLQESVQVQERMSERDTKVRQVTEPVPTARHVISSTAPLQQIKQNLVQFVQKTSAKIASAPVQLGLFPSAALPTNHSTLPSQNPGLAPRPKNGVQNDQPRCDYVLVETRVLKRWMRRYLVLDESYIAIYESDQHYAQRQKPIRVLFTEDMLRALVSTEDECILLIECQRGETLKIHCGNRLRALEFKVDLVQRAFKKRK